MTRYKTTPLTPQFVKYQRLILSKYTQEQRSYEVFDYMVKKEAELLGYLGTRHQHNTVDRYIDALRWWVEYVTHMEKK